MKKHIFRTLFICVAVLASLGMLSDSISALPITVKTLYYGKTITLGTIDPKNVVGGQSVKMSATFTLADDYKWIDKYCDFRWFQIITKDSWPADYNEKSGSIPIVDPPSGGWDYQQPKGEDKDPFYWHTTNEWPTHHTEQKGSDINDNPGKGLKSGSTLWETYLAAFNPSKKDFCILDGFSWGFTYTVGATPSVVVTGPTDINTFNLQTYKDSLTNGGFSSWSVHTGSDLKDCCPVPEPTTILLLGSALAGFAGFRKRLSKS